MQDKVRVAGSLNTPAYEWPLRAGIALVVLSPVSAALRVARRRGFRRVRGVLGLVRWVGPERFLGLGAVALLFALAVRRARVARRRDLEVGPGRFALVDRRGRREFDDSEVVALGFRPRSAAAGMAAIQRGRASIWVDGREGPDRLELDWEYPDAEGDPLAGFLGRLADRLLARAVRAIDSGSAISGDGWELTKAGLRVGDSAEVLPFASVAQAEYHDGQLLIWRAGEVEPSARVAEGSKNDAILHAILVGRMPAPAEPRAVAPLPGLGRLLFERRPSRSDRAAAWLGAGLLVAAIAAFAAISSRLGTPPAVGIAATGFGLLAFLPALIRERSAFRFHERGVARSGLFGPRELPFEDLAEVRVRPVSSSRPLLRLKFRPVPGRGRGGIALELAPTDGALETVRAYVPGGRFPG